MLRLSRQLTGKCAAISFLSAFCPMLCALLLQGCAISATGGREAASVEIALRHDGRFTADGQVVPLRKLPKRLKSMGASPATAITIVVRNDVSTGMLSAITQQLSAAGYRKLVFARPTQAGAFATSKNRR